jgi:hypothetical protein
MPGRGKQKVMVSFSSRLSIITFSALSIWSLSNTFERYRSSLNASSVYIVLPSVFQELQLAISFSIAAILPCFRLLFQSSDEVRVYSTEAVPREEEQKTSQSVSFGLESVRNDHSSHGNNVPRSGLFHSDQLPKAQAEHDRVEKKSDRSASSSSDDGIRPASSRATASPEATRRSESSASPSETTKNSRTPFVL